MKRIENLKEFKQLINTNIKTFGTSANFNLSLKDKLILLTCIFFIPFLFCFGWFIARSILIIGTSLDFSLENINYFVFMMFIPTIAMVYGIVKFNKIMFFDKLLGIFIATVGPVGIAFSAVLSSIIKDSTISLMVSTLIYGSIVIFFLRL